MICLDCKNVIIRTVSSPYEESFYFCSLDGVKITTLFTKCNKYEKEAVNETKEESKEEQEAGKEGEVTEFMCDVCGKGFRTKFSLTGHMRSHGKKES